MSAIPEKMLIELSKLEQSAVIRLYEIDLTSIGGSVFRFHSGLNENMKPLIWQGLVYDAFPAKMDGVQRSAKGASNRPTLTLSNVTGVVTGLFSQYQELVGAEVYVRDVFVKFLDPSNFKSGKNPNHDPSQEYISYYIIQKPNQITRDAATFELSLPMEADNFMIPSNIITCNSCQWHYRKTGCGYNGNAYFDRLGNPVGSIDEDKCGKRETDCQLRFGSGSIPIRFFPSANKVGR